MISKEALEEIIQVSEMYPDGIHKKEELKEIKWLSGGRQQGKTYQLIKEQQKEITRLNNIIDELEKELKEAYEEYKDVEDISLKIMAQTSKVILGKIKYLKEGK